MEKVNYFLNVYMNAIGDTACCQFGINKELEARFNTELFESTMVLILSTSPVACHAYEKGTNSALRL